MNEVRSLGFSSANGWRKIHLAFPSVRHILLSAGLDFLRPTSIPARVFFRASDLWPVNTASAIKVVRVTRLAMNLAATCFAHEF